jgi:rhodanese-related sulfurtransferase
LLIVLIAALLAIANNLVNPNRVAWVGYWPNVNSSDSVWISPSHEEGDPQHIRLAEAFDRFNSEQYLFVDAREPDEYAEGHVKGAINLPFDSFDDYWSKVEPQLPRESKIVTYCSGSECESSLFLARLLIKDYGYKDVEIFFGGWSAWNKHRLPIEGNYADEVASE